VKIFRIDPLAGEYALPGHNFVTCNVPPTTMQLLAVDSEFNKYDSEVTAWFVAGIQSILGYSSAYLTYISDFGGCEDNGACRNSES
jgi:hypothetical protein